MFGEIETSLQLPPVKSLTGVNYVNFRDVFQPYVGFLQSARKKRVRSLVLVLLYM